MDSVGRLRTRFAALTSAIARRLPFGLAEVVAPSLVGYLLINLGTFFLDVGLLGLFHGVMRLPIPAAVTLSYGTASVISYLLNRVLNFGSHEAVGRQFPLYVVVSGSNYLIFVLGLTDLLSSAGVYYEFSRVLAACCEAVYLYCMMRWVVFRDAPAAITHPAVTHPAITHRAGADPLVTGPSAAEPLAMEAELARPEPSSDPR